MKISLHKDMYPEEEETRTRTARDYKAARSLKSKKTT
jgi:hypothetical protein